jgi:hypothetical protein
MHQNISPERKACETRLRKGAERQGYKLVKSKSKSPKDVTFGKFHLMGVANGSVVFGWGNEGRGFAATAEQVEIYLNGVGQVQ